MSWLYPVYRLSRATLSLFSHWDDFNRPVPVSLATVHLALQRFQSLLCLCQLTTQFVYLRGFVARPAASPIAQPPFRRVQGVVILYGTPQSLVEGGFIQLEPAVRFHHRQQRLQPAGEYTAEILSLLLLE